MKKENLTKPYRTIVTDFVDDVFTKSFAIGRFSSDLTKFVIYCFRRRKKYCNKIGIDEEKREYCSMSGRFCYKDFAESLCDYVDAHHTQKGNKNYYCRCLNTKI